MWRLTAVAPRSVFRWFGPPDLSHPDLRRGARALWVASWPFFAVVTVMLGVAVLLEPQTLGRRAITIAAVGALILILHTLSRAGRPVLASWILVVGLSVIVTQRAWITGGIHAPVAVFYVLFILMAGVLIGLRGGFVTALVCFLGAIVLTVGTSLGWLVPRPGAGSALEGLAFVVLAIGLALVVQSLMALRPRDESSASDAVQMLVHDMRSPILAVLANLEQLRPRVGRENAREVEAAIGGAATLRRMTNSLLDISRLDKGQMPVQRSDTDVSTLAYSAVTLVQQIQPRRDIIVETYGDTVCNCDPELTRRIIDNLVSNAIKHTAVDGRIRVAITGSWNKVCIAVSDEGRGVSVERRARIFEPYNAEGLVSTTGPESLGLGLAFCKLAAEAQGGTIRVEDATPRGSVFVVELPRWTHPNTTT